MSENLGKISYLIHLCNELNEPKSCTNEKCYANILKTIHFSYEKSWE